MTKPQLVASLGSTWINIDIWNKQDGDYLKPSGTLDEGYLREALQIEHNIEINDITFEDNGIQVCVAFAGHNYKPDVAFLAKLVTFFKRHYTIANNRPQL